MKKYCNNCGCERVLQVTAKVHVGTTTYGLKRVCFACLLQMCEVLNLDGTINKDKIMEVAK